MPMCAGGCGYRLDPVYIELGETYHLGCEPRGVHSGK